MNIIKWNSALYDSKHAFVSSYGEDLLELLMPEENQWILDLGCGTGDLAYQISKSGAIVTGIDSSVEMINVAKEKYPDIVFEVKDATDFLYDQRFDAIFSNAALHWILDKEKVIECMFKNLKTGGKLVAEFGGKGNVATLMEALENALKRLKLEEKVNSSSRWYFPSVGEYTSLLESRGFFVKYALHIDRPTELRSENGIKDWFRMFGTGFLDGLSENETEDVLEETQNSVKELLFSNGNWYADYKRLRIVAIKT